jgi:hypothetical protein
MKTRQQKDDDATYLWFPLILVGIAVFAAVTRKPKTPATMGETLPATGGATLPFASTYGAPDCASHLAALPAEYKAWALSYYTTGTPIGFDAADFDKLIGALRSDGYNEAADCLVAWADGVMPKGPGPWA